MKDVIVKNSKIQGMGVFAQKDFRKSGVIIQIDDTHIITDESELSEKDKNHCDYLISKIVLMQPPEVYINHSCEPNTYVKTINGLRYVLAIRDIKIGEEITYDYAVNGFYDGANNICHCDSKRCRGVINCNFFKLSIALQKEYLPYLDDYFIQRFEKEINILNKKYGN